MSPLHLECRLSSISASKQIATGAILSVKCQPIMISKSYVYSNITYHLGHLMLLGSIDLHLSVSSFFAVFNFAYFRIFGSHSSNLKPNRISGSWSMLVKIFNFNISCKLAQHA